MAEMSDYTITEKDIEWTITFLKHHDPDNADREYAIELLNAMQDTAKELVDQNLSFAQLMETTFKKRS